MPYYLSYVLNKNPDIRDVFGHASLVLTECRPPDDKLHVISKVGFFGSNGVSFEDWMYKPELGYTFQHKTYPITAAEAKKFGKIVNEDIARKNNPGISNAQPGEIPAGPTYDLLNFNCKTYALSVLREVGIVDASLFNWFIDIPIRSGPLHDFKPTKMNQGIVWDNPMVVSKRAKVQTFKGATAEEIKQMEITIRVSEYFHAFEDLMKLLEKPYLQKVSGIQEFKESIQNIKQTLISREHDERFLDIIQKNTESAIEAFEQAIKNESNGLDKDKSNGLGRKLLEVIKGVAHYLSGGRYHVSSRYTPVSSRYTPEQVLYLSKKHIENTAVKQIGKPAEKQIEGTPTVFRADPK